MSSLGAVKYKMHRAVNYLFYAMLIGLGFVIGSGIKIIPGIIENITKYINIL